MKILPRTPLKYAKESGKSLRGGIKFTTKKLFSVTRRKHFDAGGSIESQFASIIISPSPGRSFNPAFAFFDNEVKLHPPISLEPKPRLIFASFLRDFLTQCLLAFPSSHDEFSIIYESRNFLPAFPYLFQHFTPESHRAEATLRPK